MNLIITPVYHAFDRVKQMCEALDQNSRQEFLHVLVGDNCGEIPVEVSEHRVVLTMRNDYLPGEHKSREGQALDLAYQYGTQKYTPYGPTPKIDHVFLIESDVMVGPDWDVRMLELSKSLSSWATLDCVSIDKEGKIGYPSAVSPRHGVVELDGHKFDHQHYPDFQCTLFNPIIWHTGIRFSDFPDHFDVLFGRKSEEISGLQHYRTEEITVRHYAFSSRSQLPGSDLTAED